MFRSFYRIYKGVYSLPRIQGMNHARKQKKMPPSVAQGTSYLIYIVQLRQNRKKALNVKKSHDIIYSAIDISIEYKG